MRTGMRPPVRGMADSQRQREDLDAVGVLPTWSTSADVLHMWVPVVDAGPDIAS
jgi:hypothetical protein